MYSAYYQKLKKYMKLDTGLPPGREYGELKNGRSVTLPDGRVIEPKDVVGPPR